MPYKLITLSISSILNNRLPAIHFSFRLSAFSFDNYCRTSHTIAHTIGTHMISVSAR